MPTEPPPIAALLVQAEAWQRDLDEGVVKTRAAIAAREGVSGMWVTCVLGLLDLHPVVREWIRSLPPGTPARYVTERTLRSITKLRHLDQLDAVRRRWPEVGADD